MSVETDKNFQDFLAVAKRAYDSDGEEDTPDELRDHFFGFSLDGSKKEACSYQFNMTDIQVANILQTLLQHYLDKMILSGEITPSVANSRPAGKSFVYNGPPTKQ